MSARIPIVAAFCLLSLVAASCFASRPAASPPVAVSRIAPPVATSQQPQSPCPARVRDHQVAIVVGASISAGWNPFATAEIERVALADCLRQALRADTWRVVDLSRPDFWRAPASIGLEAVVRARENRCPSATLIALDFLPWFAIKGGSAPQEGIKDGLTVLASWQGDLVLGSLPRNILRLGASKKRLDSAVLEELNDEVAAWCSTRAGCYLLVLDEVIDDWIGQQPMEDFFLRDGVHLTEEGTCLVAKEIYKKLETAE